MYTIPNCLNVRQGVIITADQYPTTVEELLVLTNIPVVAINQESQFTFINDAFTDTYGWSKDDLIGKSVINIMPKYMRSAHNVGFSRFLATESSTILGKVLQLQVLYKDGTEKLSNHYILADKQDGVWRFAAILEKPE